MVATAYKGSSSTVWNLLSTAAISVAFTDVSALGASGAWPHQMELLSTMQAQNNCE